MELLTVFFAFASFIGLGLVIWGKYTKSGKRWVEGDY